MLGTLFVLLKCKTTIFIGYSTVNDDKISVPVKVFSMFYGSAIKIKFKWIARF